LKIAGAAQKVEVQAQSQSIATEDAVTGQVIDRRLINDLPIISRTVTELTYLAPGINDPDDQCHNCGSTNFVSNGSRGASADILMDGASITNFEPNGGITQAVYTPSPEAVEEFKVQQTNFSAEYGFSGASILNMVTRSGTNSFHGSAYDFIRNTITDANNWFNDRATPVIPIPPVHRHDFGGTIGGPIFKDKTFFFFDFEGLRSSDMRTYFAGVPDAAFRSANAVSEASFPSSLGFRGGMRGGLPKMSASRARVSSDKGCESAPTESAWPGVSFRMITPPCAHDFENAFYDACW